MTPSRRPLSAAVFCPQNKPPKASYLASIRHSLLRTPSLSPLLEAIHKLPATWDLYAATNPDIAAMKQGPRYIEHIRAWIANDETDNTTAPLTEIMSGIITLPVLTIIQVVQYFQYLEYHDLRHAQLLEELSIGGAQGFCGGMLPVVAIASSVDEDDLARNAAKALRIALGVGAYAELGDEEDVPGPTTMVLRTKYDGQADELVDQFKGTYISAVSEPTCVSVVGPVRRLEELKAHAESQQGLSCTPLYLRGKVHNPENRDLSRELCALCDRTEDLRLPRSARLRIPVRTNATGEVLSDDVPLSTEVIETALVFKCQWWTMMDQTSDALLAAGQTEITLAAFGTGRKNCVPTRLFEGKGLRVGTLDAESFADLSSRYPPPSTIYPIPQDAVAIVGAACRLPGASSLSELWDLISAGESRASGIPPDRFDPAKSNTLRELPKGGNKPWKRWYGNFVDDIRSFDNAFFSISSREATYMDPQQRLLLETAYEALDSSGYLRHHRRDDYDNVGCFLGSTYTEYLENTSGYAPAAYTAPGTIRAFQNGKISYHFGWSGPSEVIDTACSSSLVAINRACKAIQARECPMALAGGVNIITGMHNFLDLGKAGFLSPTGQCKPFDAGADGYCRADGVGLVVLKSLSRATADGDDILGVIPAVSTNHGGLSPGITVPYSRAQVALFKSVLRRSGLGPGQVSYIEAHGTGTRVGDPIEIASIREVFGGMQREDKAVHVGSIKANVGHSEAAAGIGSLLKVLAMLQHEQIPPLAGFSTLNPQIPSLEDDHLRVDTQTSPWDRPLRAALVNSYGASGSNSALICCQRPPKQGFMAQDEALLYPIVLSAATRESLVRFKAKLALHLKRVPLAPDSRRVANVAYTLSERRQAHRLRWTTTARTLHDLTRSLDQDEVDALDAPQTARPPRPVVLVFSGQSTKNIELCRSWYRRFPRLRLHLDRCNDILRSLGFPDVIPCLFQEKPLDSVVTLQCGTFALQYSCAMCWIDAGLDVAAVCGHSFGELTAMAVSNVLSLKDALRLVGARATLVETKWPSERGVMLAIHGDRATVHNIMQTAISEAGLEGPLEVACFNGPRSQILVGSSSDIGKTENLLHSNIDFQGVNHQRLDVTHAFHSALVEPMLGKLAAVASELQFGDPEIPLESCTEFPLESVTADRIVQHTRRPVFFQNAVGRLEDRLGPCVWLEAGLSSPIVGMVKRTVRDPTSHLFLPLKPLDGSTDAVTNTSTCLWREGLRPAFWEFASPGDSGLQPVWLPPYQFQKTPHWLPYKYPEPDGQGNVAGAGDDERSHQSTPSLISMRKVSDGAPPSSSLEFTVHTETDRFTDVVCGHAVRGHPLCPVSMYMECVVMGVQMRVPGQPISWFKFEDLHCQSGLGVSQDSHVSMQLMPSSSADTSSWDFAFSSRSRAASNPRSRLHAKGSFKLITRSDLGLYQRLMWDKVEALATNPGAEQLMSGRAYTLFSRVVQYSECMRGISHIAMLGNEAVAEVRRPAKPVSVSETTASGCCDSVSLDTFIQVVGLLINSSEACPVDDVFIASHIESVVVQDCGLDDAATRKVYAKTRPKNQSQVAGDLLVFTEEGKLVMILSGIQFTRLPISKLEAMLDQNGIQAGTTAGQRRSDQTDTREGNSLTAGLESRSRSRLLDVPELRSRFDARHGTPEAVVAPDDRVPSTQSSDPKQTPDSDSNTDSPCYPQTPSSAIRDDEPASSGLRQQLFGLIADHCGGSLDQVKADASLEEMGIDSLSAVELREALEVAFDVQLSNDYRLLDSTIDEIHTCVNAQRRAW